MSELHILFDHPDFLIFDKSAGLSFHSESGKGAVVLAEELTGAKLYSVHRLDKMTSGLLILAKTPHAAATLTNLFERRLIEKYYLAISLRRPKKKQGWVKGDMAASRRGSYKLLATCNHPALTQFVSTALRPHERLFLIKPHTGKTHQIRVALKSLGAPIAGDERYADATEARKEDRGYLHAYALRFVYQDEEICLTCKPQEGLRFGSAECQAALESVYAQPWRLFGIRED
ncbi:MAG: TIGR01621 family pseudouridine synthase [Campylobacterales bacterium]|nr:TIGR01621 family pseudouridine synthase [Campylobacterales bacterium]